MAAGIEKGSFNLRFRINLALGFVFLCFFTIVLRLWYLQILRGDHFRNRSENNRLRKVYLPPPRGMIFDRQGRVLVKNRPAFNVELVKEDCGNCKRTLENLAEVSGTDLSQLGQAASRPQKKRRRFEPKVLLKDVQRDLVARIIAKRHLLPGIIIKVIPAREYVHKSFASHVLGYLGEINSKQLESGSYYNYLMGDLVGQYGVEKVQEQFLRGQRGEQGVIVNARGSMIAEAYSQLERVGHNVYLTLDLDLQAAAEEAMLDKAGALVAIDPNTGELLAMLSKPAFDSNAFTGGISAKLWNQLLTGAEKRLSNRAVQGTYPPGSVFKFVMAVAALSEGVASVDDAIKCSGAYRIGRSRAFHCHHSHGVVSLKDALKRSCNVYFYTMGQRLGIDRIHDYANRFGLGKYTGLDLVEEQKGLVPSTEWKKTNFKPPENRWYPGETPSVSIGQGAVSVTPLQVARAMAALVNGGRLYKPFLLKKVEFKTGSSLAVAEPAVQGQLAVEPWVLEFVKSGLAAVVNEKGGTGSRASLREEFGVEVGGKTGTAQLKALVGSKELQAKNSLAWFAGFAPVENSQIVVVALVEGGGHGGVSAAPVVKQVMQAYFAKILPPLQKEPTQMAALK